MDRGPTSSHEIRAVLSLQILNEQLGLQITQSHSMTDCAKAGKRVPTLRLAGAVSGALSAGRRAPLGDKGSPGQRRVTSLLQGHFLAHLGPPLCAVL